MHDTRVFPHAETAGLEGRIVWARGSLLVGERAFAKSLTSIYVYSCSLGWYEGQPTLLPNVDVGSIEHKHEHTQNFPKTEARSQSIATNQQELDPCPVEQHAGSVVASLDRHFDPQQHRED